MTLTDKIFFNCMPSIMFSVRELTNLKEKTVPFTYYNLAVNQLIQKEICEIVYHHYEIIYNHIEKGIKL